MNNNITKLNCSLRFAPVAVMCKAAALACLFVLLGVVSCSLPDVNEVVMEDEVSTNLSLPIGWADMTVAEMIQAGNLRPVNPDTLTLDPNLFLDNGIYYKTPSRFDTIMSFEFSLGQISERLDLVKYLMLRVNLLNMTHGSANVKIVLEATDGSLVDSLFTKTPIVLRGAKIGADNRISTPETARYEDVLDSTRIMNLGAVEKLRVDVSFDFPKGQLPVVVMPEDRVFWVQLGCRTIIEANPNEL